MNFKPHQLVYYKGKLSETISFPTPEETIMLRTTPDDPTTMIEVPVGDIVEPLDYLFQIVGNSTPHGLAKVLERVGMDHGSVCAIQVAGHCLKKHMNLSHCWDLIRFFIHDILRQGNPDFPRENIFLDTIHNLCDSVAIILRCLNDDGENVSRSENCGPDAGDHREGTDLHRDLRQEGREGQEDALPEGSH